MFIPTLYRNKLQAKVLLFLFIPCITMLTAESSAVENIQQIREFMIDPPTLRCLGFRWYIYGDDNGDATVNVRYRRTGDTPWEKALPMLRVNREVANWDFHPYACENLFAGSIFNLTPDTEYEVRCSMVDPDGGEADTTVVVRTREVPSVPELLRTLHVTAEPSAGKENTYTTLHEAVKNLKPGDLVLIHGGRTQYSVITFFWGHQAMQSRPARRIRRPRSITMATVRLDRNGSLSGMTGRKINDTLIWHLFITVQDLKKTGSW